MGAKRPARREFLKSGAALAGGLTSGAAAPASGQAPESGQAHHSPPMIKEGKDQVSPTASAPAHVSSVRIAHGGRPSPDNWGLTFHVAAPLQDSVGVITPSSLHYMGTTRGSFLPDIDPKEHRLMVHGLVDRPLTFTMEDLKRLPSVTRIHFIECAGNRSSRRAKNVQETHGMTSCAEWTGVLLSTLLKECGLKGTATWFVAEGAEEVKGASSMPIAKAMEDCFVAYGMNGEAVRPQNGFPLRLMIPGFEGIFHTKWLRRIKVVDRYYMNYNDYGHLDCYSKVAALDYQIRPKSVITFPSAGQQLPGRGFYEIQRSRLVRRRRHQAGGSVDRRWQALEQSRDQGDATAHGPCPFRLSLELGTDRRPSSSRGARTNRAGSAVASTDCQRPEKPTTRHSACRAWTTAFSRGGSPAMEASPMALLRVLALALLMGASVWRSRPRTVSDARRARRKSARGISPSVRPGRNSRRGAEP